MLSRWLLGSFSFAGAALASALPAVAAPQPLGEWTVSEVQRNRTADGTKCSWHLAVSSAPKSTFDCDFTVMVPSGQDCALNYFARSGCSGNSQFTVNGGHNDEGFVVLTLMDDAQDTEAFFGFTDSALDAKADIPEQTRPTYLQSAIKQDELATRSAGWSLINLERAIDDYLMVVTITFNIIDENQNSLYFLFNPKQPVGTNLATISFYHRQCDLNGWYVSWGYDTSNGGTVIITVINPSKKQAFFGFRNIDGKDKLGNTGPNPVSPCNC